MQLKHIGVPNSLLINMNTTRTARVLRLVMLLSGTRRYALEDLAEKFQTSERTIFRDLDTLREVGLLVECKDGRYRLESESVYQSRLHRLFHFTEEEAVILYHILESMKGTSAIKEKLVKKLHVFYDLNVLQQLSGSDDLKKIETLSTAIRQGKQVKLMSYRSSNSQTIADKIVEPFDFSPNYEHLWAYEPSSGICKQFRIQRIVRVTLLTTYIQYKGKHRKPFVDIFRMSAEEPVDTVRLRLSLKASNLLREEYPLSEEYITRLDDNSYILTVPVANYKGVGRFVVGLLDEVIIEASSAFRAHLHMWINKYRKKIES